MLTVDQVRELAEGMSSSLDEDGRATDTVRSELERIDREELMSSPARDAFQDFLARAGVKTAHPIRLPIDHEPYWFRDGQPLAGFQSQEVLPDTADVVIIGAGLTGAATAYHLSEQAAKGARIIIVERGDPACEASGRNGGNFELLPESSIGMYEGLARERAAFLQRRYPDVPLEVIHAESERQASLVLGLSLRNRDLLKGIILRERIECDFAPRGWVHLACTEEQEQGMCEEVMLAAQHGQRIELWSRRKIREELGVDNAFLARFIPDDGTYHPFKYACGLLHSALRDGVELYTRTQVCRVTTDSDESHRVETSGGTITARCVVVATNAFTSQLFPELSAIRPFQSQIQVTEHAPDRTRGRVVTCEDGPAFFNQPRGEARNGRAPLLLGGGADRPMESPSSRRRSPKVHQELLALRDRFYPELRGQPPSAEWVGPMAFTPDALPVIGFLRPGVIVAAGYNGYGGSYTTVAGQAAAHMATTGSPPDWVPEDVFSPRRLLSDTPMFMSERQSLWRIASALCGQLKAVNRRISEALTLRTCEDISAVPRQTAPRVSRMIRPLPTEFTPASTIDPRILAAFPVFEDFRITELEEVLASTMRWDLPRGTLLFEEGDEGCTSYIVVHGVVDVSVKVRGQAQLLAQLAPGAIFGQASLIDAAPRSVSCSIHRDATLVEIDAMACERFLDRSSPIALKLLAALNQGLVCELRNADRRLLRLDVGSPSTDVR
jgi:glycine/D-amino acid oxidase-like deaminating enzyme